MELSPAIKNGWLRVLLFLIGYLLLIFFGNTLLGVLMRFTKINTTPENLFYVTVLLNTVIAFSFVSFFRIAFDKRPLHSLGFRWKKFGKERCAGVLTAVLLLTCMSSILWLMKLTDWFTSGVDVTALLLTVIMLVLISFAEELVFRGYVLHNLMQSMPKEAALFTSAVLFALFHSLNPNFNLIAFINIFLAGILLGINYIFSRNLWFAVFFHFTWNFLQGPVLGFEVSGLALPSLLEQNLRGSVLLTGGAFGLEASWLTTFVVSIASLVLFYVFQRKYRNVE